MNFEFRSSPLVIRYWIFFFITSGSTFLLTGIFGLLHIGHDFRINLAGRTYLEDVNKPFS